MVVSYPNESINPLNATFDCIQVAQNHPKYFLEAWWATALLPWPISLQFSLYIYFYNYAETQYKNTININMNLGSFTDAFTSYCVT